MKYAHRIRLFFVEARQELKKVEWPTRQQTARLTGIVVGLSLLVATFLGVFDYLFSRLLEYILIIAR